MLIYGLMMRRFFLSLFLILLYSLNYAQTEAEYQILIDTFHDIRANSIWPVVGGSFDDIEETFGPRIQPSTGFYDWHRGIDIDGAHGSNIVAILDGEFDRYLYYSAGGWTVVLKHPFPKSLNYKGKVLTHFYTFYMHLNDTNTPQFIKDAQQNQQHPPVSKGQIIGLMGNSGKGPGDDYGIHLHLDLRVGGSTSLEYQLDNPNTTQWGFDTHMHPMLLYPPLTNTLTLQIISNVTNTDFTRLRFISSNDDQPLLNRVEISLIDPLTQLPIKEHVLDFNRRTGFNANTTALLDSRDFLKPYMDPEYFLDAQTDYRTQIVIPKAFVEDSSPSSLKVVAYDIWGKKAEYQNSTAFHLFFQKSNKLLIWEISPDTFTKTSSYSLTLPKRWKVVDANSFPGQLLVKRGSRYALLSFEKNSVGKLLSINQKISGKVVGIADVNQDKTLDFILQKGASVNLMNNLSTNTFDFSTIQPLTKTTAKIKGLGDFDLDGFSDLLYQKKTALNTINLSTFQSKSIMPLLRLKEKVLKVGNAQNDGTPDILTRYKTSLQLWLGSSNSFPISLGSPGRSWKMVAFH